MFVSKSPKYLLRTCLLLNSHIDYLGHPTTIEPIENPLLILYIYIFPGKLYRLLWKAGVEVLQHGDEKSGKI